MEMHHRENLRRTAVFFLILCLLASPSASLVSQAEDDASSAPGDTVTAAREAGLALAVQSNDIEGWPAGPAVTSPAAILMDMDTGTVLYAKNIHEHHYPASITKIMTALLAVENGQPGQTVTFSHDAVFNIEAGSANVGMKEGEQITLDEALRCMMSASANECANAIAETIGGTYDHFIDMMNEKAASLGCTDSHFVNPHGLFDENHYISASDMALIASAAYKNAWFRDICCLQTYNRPVTAMNDNGWCISNKHKMFREGSPYYYEGCTGGKTGYTVEARNTLVTYAERNGMRLVCIVLQTEGYDVYTNTAALFDYGFGCFKDIPVSGNTDTAVIKSVDSDSSITLPADASVSDTQDILTVNNDSNTGSISYSYHGCSIGSASITLTDSYLDSVRSGTADESEAETEPAAASDTAEGTAAAFGTPAGSLTFWLITAVLAASAAAVITLLIRHKKKHS